MKSVVPDLRRLMHSIESTKKLPYVSFQARLGKSGQLLHVLDFFFGKDSIQEHSLDIVLLETPVKGSGYVENHVKRFKSSSGRCCFTEDSPPDLLESFCHPSNFEVYQISDFIMFQLADEPPTQNAAVSGDFRTRDECIYTHIM